MLPSLQFLEQIPQQILSIPNKRKESKRREHYCLFLLGHKAGLRVSEAINFDLSKKLRNGLYRIEKSKGKKERLAYIPKQIVRELKKHHWKPNRTNRFNFYHFLKSIKKELGISNNTELTPHTLRRAFATYHAEAGLPLPLLQKLLGHQSIRTTALYWMNTYHGDDDDDSDTGAILCGKNWLEKQEPVKSDSELPTIGGIPPQPDRITHLIENSPALWEINQSLSNCQHQLAEKDQQIAKLTAEKGTLQSNLSNLGEQNANLKQDLSNLRQETAQETTEKHQIQQNLTAAEETIKQLEQKLTNEREQKNIIRSNLAQQKQNNQSLKETNTILTQKLSHSEQTITNLQNAYQIALKDKELAHKHLNQLTTEIKNFAKTLHQWQKINYYQQLEQQKELKAQILQPPPWKPGK